jgi:hypothetical protein
MPRDPVFHFPDEPPESGADRGWIMLGYVLVSTVAAFVVATILFFLLRKLGW